MASKVKMIGSTEATQPEIAEEREVLAMNPSEAAVRDAYQVAERNDLAGWINCFTEDGTFTDESIGVTYRGKQLSQPVEIYAAAFPDMHRELYRFFVDGDTVIVELALQGTHKGSLKSPLGTLPPTGKRMDAVLRRVSLEKRQDSILQLLSLGNGDLRAARLAVESRSSHRKALSSGKRRSSSWIEHSDPWGLVLVLALKVF